MRSTGRRRVAVALLVAGLVVAGGAPGAAADGGVVPQTGDVDPDGVVLRVDVAEDGTASWTVEYRIRLDDETTTAAFEELRADVRENRTGFRSRFETRMTRTVAAAENETGREMSLRNVSVTAETRQLPQTYGVVAYRFEWDGSPASTASRSSSATPSPDSSSTRRADSWSRGRQTTTPRRSLPAATRTATPPSRGRAGRLRPGPAAGRAPAGGAGGSGGLPSLALVGGVVVLALAAAVGYGYRRRGRSGTPAAGDGDESDDTPNEPPEELLSPEERVLRFVRENGGRVKQQAVVTEFDWTAARTSQVVGSLRDDGRVETFRLGRENVITLPDVGVEGDGDDGDDRDDDRDLDPAA
ncbi:MAG: hypothetical protein A07HB70_01198 [uncultured archaeon A07HB70]|nr:MAG: hypothetical protein A07HB70_01198 [uncultured archaeon A07HB70]